MVREDLMRTVEQELIDVAREWDRAMITNDANSIGQYMADEWTITGPDGSTTDKTKFLELIRSGVLSHDVMASENIRVRVYGDTAVLTARGVSGGKFHNQPFREEEQGSNVFVRIEGRWRCVLTHLSRLTPK
jgi:ketosteroid isomerase-like protein